MRSLLLREFVEHALYARGGYFAAKHVVGGLRMSLPYASLKGETDYREAIRSSWEAGKAGTAWLTPSECFTPFYGEAIARSIVARHKATYEPGTPLQMLEVGGGNGTCASDVLRFLRREEPELYASCKYMLVEISPALADAQHARLVADVGDGARFDVVNECAHAWSRNAAASGSTLSGPWWINMFEVLDNLGHDLLRVTDNSHGGSEAYEAIVGRDDRIDNDHLAAERADAEVMQAIEAARGSMARGGGGGAGGGSGYVAADGGAEASPAISRVMWLQHFQPLQDPQIAECASLLGMTSAAALEELRGEVAQTEGAAAGSNAAFNTQNFFGGLFGMRPDIGEVFVPTGCWQLLNSLCAAIPQHQFTIADYCWFPPHPDRAINHPVVQTQSKGRTIDMKGQYLLAAGEADIMFPTNFDHLATMITAASSGSGSGSARAEATAHMSSADFMRAWHDLGATQTQGGRFNPLVDDFTNTRFVLTGVGRANEAQPQVLRGE